MFGRKKREFDVLNDRLHSLFDLIHKYDKKMEERIEYIEDKMDLIESSLIKLGDRISKLEHKDAELSKLRQDINDSHEFVKGLVMTLIASPPKPSVEAPAKMTVADYLAKKANGDASKPKLPG